MTLTGNMFYPEERVVFEQSKTDLDEELTVYKQDLEFLEKALTSRKNDLFKPLEMPNVHYSIEKIQQYSRDINNLVSQNNTRTKILGKDKNAARDALRLTDVASFIQTINYDDEIIRIENLNTEANKASTDFLDARNQVTE